MPHRCLCGRLFLGKRSAYEVFLSARDADCKECPAQLPED